MPICAADFGLGPKRLIAFSNMEVTVSKVQDLKFILQAGETDLNKSIDRVKFTYYRPNQSFCDNNFYRNAIRTVLLLFHGNLNVRLHVLYKMTNKMNVQGLRLTPPRT